MKSKKVLLCDRDIAFLGVTKIMLQQAGHMVETLHDCEALPEMMKKVRPDIVFVDVRFHDGGSREVVRMLKSNPETENIPLIVFSSEDAREEAMSSGANGYLKKPFSVQELELVMRMSLN